MVLNYDHDQEDLHKALGLSDKQENRCKAALVFAILNAYMRGCDLYGNNPEQTPASLTSKTGILEQTLTLVSSNAERVYVLLHYREFYNSTQDVLTDLLAEQETGEPKTLDPNQTLQQIMSRFVKRMHMDSLRYTMQLVRESGHDFEEFYDILTKHRKSLEKAIKDGGDKHKDVNDLLNRLFSEGE